MRNSGLEGVHGVISAASGDFDNDGLSDLCIVTEQGPILFHNTKGKFERSPRICHPAASSGPFASTTITITISICCSSGENTSLLRNQGTAGFVDHTKDVPFMPGHASGRHPYRWMADSKSSST